MCKALALVLALALDSSAQVVEVRLAPISPGAVMSAPASPLRLSLEGPRLSLQTPSLHPTPVLVPVPVPVPAAHQDPAHWSADIVVDRDYAAILDRGAGQLASESLRPAALETMRAKDGRIYSHMMRVGILSGMIAKALGASPQVVREAAWAARLHDIGKAEEAILAVVNKEGKLTPEEREVMMKHPQVGAEMLFRQTDIPYDLHWPAMRAALSHHELMDGSGYPQGLKGTEIPLEARITAVADYFDALLEHRPYRAAMTIPQALEIMHKVKDRFDPQVWAAFLTVVHPV